jgi:hypothetical protein
MYHFELARQRSAELIREADRARLAAGVRRIRKQRRRAREDAGGGARPPAVSRPGSAAPAPVKLAA